MSSTPIASSQMNMQAQIPHKNLYVHIVMDMSGSMKSVLDETIDGYNSYVESLLNKLNDDGKETVLTLKLFNSLEIKNVDEEIIIQQARKLTKYEYKPAGYTPLYDAIGESISEARKFKSNNPNTLIQLVIITDGKENHSKEFGQTLIKQMIDDCRGDDWAVVYLGADQNAVEEGGKIGTKLSSTATFAKGNIRGVMTDLAEKSHTYLSTGMSASVDFSDEDRHNYSLEGWDVKEKTTFRN